MVTFPFEALKSPATSSKKSGTPGEGSTGQSPGGSTVQGENTPVIKDDNEEETDKGRRFLTPKDGAHSTLNY